MYGQEDYSANHTFCETCILHHCKQTKNCPLCREPITTFKCRETGEIINATEVSDRVAAYLLTPSIAEESTPLTRRRILIYLVVVILGFLLFLNVCLFSYTQASISSS
jgi:hypothetical protein